MSSRELSPSASGAAHPQPPALSCDLCGLPASNVHTKDGVILGLIVCSACAEDTLAARQLETTP